MGSFIALLLFIILVLFLLWRDEKKDAAYWQADAEYWFQRALQASERERELLERLAEDADEADWWKRGDKESS